MKLNETKTTAGGATRRDFLKTTAAAALAAPLIVPSRVFGANDRLAVGYVGLGAQGFNSHLRGMKEKIQDLNIVQAAVCDVSKYRTAEAQKFAGEGCKAYSDYRKMLDEMKELDAIVCATVDHWHTRVSVDSMNAGKHVYVEKPMTRYLGEAFEVYDTVKKTGKILQVGSQGCSDQKWHKAASLIKEGKIGPIVMSQGSYMRNAPKGEWNYTIQPWASGDDVNWQSWLGTQIKKRKEFDADDYFRWRKYYQYCAGLLSDLFPHKLHPYMLATGNPEFPLRVACVGSKKVHTDKNTAGTPERDVPEIVQLIAEFPSGMVMHITSSTINEQGTQEMIRGHKASLYMAGNRVELKPEKAFSEEIDPYNSEPFPGESIPVHHKNWVDSIRANKQPNANIELAVRVQTVVSLGEISERLNVMCLFDEKTRQIKTADGKVLEPISYENDPILKG